MWARTISHLDTVVRGCHAAYVGPHRLMQDIWGQSLVVTDVVQYYAECKTREGEVFHIHVSHLVRMNLPIMVRNEDSA